eukprot:COSAG04_NODE_168_length_21684_cov_19.787121_13_plen_227_part_00
MFSQARRQPSLPVDEPAGPPSGPYRHDRPRGGSLGLDQRDGQQVRAREFPRARFRRAWPAGSAGGGRALPWHGPRGRASRQCARAHRAVHRDRAEGSAAEARWRGGGVCCERFEGSGGNPPRGVGKRSSGGLSRRRRPAGEAGRCCRDPSADGRGPAQGGRSAGGLLAAGSVRRAGACAVQRGALRCVHQSQASAALPWPPRGVRFPRSPGSDPAALPVGLPGVRG